MRWEDPLHKSQGERAALAARGTAYGPVNLGVSYGPLVSWALVGAGLTHIRIPRIFFAAQQLRQSAKPPSRRFLNAPKLASLPIEQHNAAAICAHFD